MFLRLRNSGCTQHIRVFDNLARAVQFVLARRGNCEKTRIRWQRKSLAVTRTAKRHLYAFGGRRAHDAVHLRPVQFLAAVIEISDANEYAFADKICCLVIGQTLWFRCGLFFHDA